MPCALCDLPTGDDPVTADDVDGEFCCRGCLEVYRTLDDEPAPEEEIEPGSRSGSKSPSRSTVPEDAETAFLSVDGMHCTTCESFVESVASDQDGVYDAAASYATEMVKVRYDGAAVDEESLPDRLSRAGYRAAFPEDGTGDSAVDRFDRDRIRTVVGILVSMSVMALYALFLYPTYLGAYPTSFLYERSTTIMVFGPIPLLSAVVLLLVGFPLLRGAYVSLRAGEPNMDVLVAFGAAAAYLYSLGVLFTGGRVVYFDVTVVIVTVVTAGNYIEKKRKRGALDTLSDLGSERVTEARVRDEDGTREVHIDDLEPGDRMVVRRGERLPADGTVAEGRAAVEEALVTGESDPRHVEPGEEVVGGAAVRDGRLVVEVGEDATSTLDRIVSQMWDIGSAEGGAQRLADRLAGAFVLAVPVLAVAVAAADLLLGEPVDAALITGVSILVVSCPCSFGLATPLAVASGVSRAATEDDVVVTNTAVLEDVADVDVVALDKTGTLTTDEMAIESVHADDPDRTLADAAAVESASDHPIATAIADRVTDPVTAEDVETHPRGIEGTVDDRRVLVGHPKLFAERGWAVPQHLSERVTEARDAGAIPTVVGREGSATGVVTVRDEPRDGWEDTVAELAAGGREVVVVTGDDQSAVSRFADHPDVAEVFTGVLPEAKAAAVRRLQAEGRVAMVGDGINDAPALAAADLGIALAEGSELASEAADATIVDRGLAAVGDLFERSRQTKRRVRQNLVWALGYNVVAVPLAALGLINPLVAAVAMGTSSVLVVVNSTR